MDPSVSLRGAAHALLPVSRCAFAPRERDPHSDSSATLRKKAVLLPRAHGAGTSVPPGVGVRPAGGMRARSGPGCRPPRPCRPAAGPPLRHQLSCRPAASATGGRRDHRSRDLSWHPGLAGTQRRLAALRKTKKYKILLSADCKALQGRLPRNCRTGSPVASRDGSSDAGPELRTLSATARCHQTL